MGFNDGIQTVITVASVFLAQELFVSKGLLTDESFLVRLILVIQFVAFGGTILFERMAARVGTKTAILISLFVWTSVVIYAIRRAADDGAGVGPGGGHRTRPRRLAGAVAVVVLANDSARA